MSPQLCYRENNICGKQIYRIRAGLYDSRHKKISQETLAARLQVSGLDMDRTIISKIESGARALKDFEIITFAQVLNVPVQVLFESVESATV